MDLEIFTTKTVVQNSRSPISHFRSKYKRNNNFWEILSKFVFQVLEKLILLKLSITCYESDTFIYNFKHKYLKISM